jgi:hypothetical protein
MTALALQKTAIKTSVSALKNDMRMKLEPSNVSLADLAAILGQIAVDYQKRGIDGMNLSGHDFYRVFLTNEMFEVYADAPKTNAIGSLQDDITALSKLLDDPDGIATSVDIERIGNILRAISDTI